MNSTLFWEEKLKGDIKPFYIFIGEKSLTSPLITNLTDRLLVDDEEREFCLNTFEGEFSIDDLLISLSTRSFVSDKKVVLLKDPYFLSGLMDKKDEESHLEKKWTELLKKINFIKKKKNWTVIIQTEHIDSRRKKIKELLDIAEVIDLRLDKSDKKASRNYVISFCNEILKRNNKNIRSDILNFFLDLVGEDDLVTIQNELEKLINFSTNSEITKEDILAVTVKSKEEQIYELTQFIGEKNLKKSLITLRHLINQQVQPIVIAGTLFNFIKRIIIIKEILSHTKIEIKSYDIFKKETFPAIKAIIEKYNLSLFYNMHPYALFINIKNSTNFSYKNLIGLYQDLYKIDLMLKSSSVNHDVILEDFIINLINENRM